jgi:hypothetical protein
MQIQWLLVCHALAALSAKILREFATQFYDSAAIHHQAD